MVRRALTLDGDPVSSSIQRLRERRRLRCGKHRSVISVRLAQLAVP